MPPNQPPVLRRRPSLVQRAPAPTTPAPPPVIRPPTSPSALDAQRLRNALLIQQGSSTAPVQSITEGLARALTAGVGGISQGASEAFERRQRGEQAQRLAEALWGGAEGAGGPANTAGLAQALVDNPALEGAAQQALARRQFPELFAQQLTPQQQAFAGLTPEQQARALGAEQVLTPQQEAFGNLTPEQQAVALGAVRPPVVREAQSDPGRLVADRQALIAAHGEDSQHVRNFDEAVEADRRGEGPRLTDVAGLRKEFTSQSRDFVAVRDAFAKIRSAAENPSAAGDLSLIFNFMKMLDPGSVVREGEFATAQNAAGVDDQVRNIYNRAITGERLNPDQRADFVGQSNRIFISQANLQQDLESTFTGIAQRQGFDPRDVVIDFRTATQAQPVGAPGAAQVPAAQPAAQAPLNEAAIPSASLVDLQLFIEQQGGEANLTDQQRRAIGARLDALGVE